MVIIKKLVEFGSERVAPGFVLLHGDITLTTQFVSEDTPCLTLCDLIC